jgi:hypothetical protein
MSRDNIYFQIAESVIREWEELLREKGIVHGEIAHKDELVEIMEKALLKLGVGK